MGCCLVHIQSPAIRSNMKRGSASMSVVYLMCTGLDLITFVRRSLLSLGSTSLSSEVQRRFNRSIIFESSSTKSIRFPPTQPRTQKPTRRQYRLISQTSPSSSIQDIPYPLSILHLTHTHHLHRQSHPYHTLHAVSAPPIPAYSQQ